MEGWSSSCKTQGKKHRELEKLQIPTSKLDPSRPFSRVGLGSNMPHGSITLLVTFRTPKNYRRESVVFDVVEVNLPFNAILDRPALYQSSWSLCTMGTWS
jgi:hypothetical protein